MSAIVDFSYYYNVYMGQEADQASFPALCARAEDIIGAVTRWQATSENFSHLTSMQQTMVKKAICAQIDSLGINGLDSVSVKGDVGFTVGKVSVNSRNGAELTRRGVMADAISPLAIMYLEQSGLLLPQVNVLPDMPQMGWF